LALAQGGLQVPDGHGSSYAHHNRVAAQRGADFPGEFRNAHRLYAKDPDAGSGGGTLVGTRFSRTGNCRHAIAFGEFSGTLGTADSGDDVNRTRSAGQHTPQDCLVHGSTAKECDWVGHGSHHCSSVCYRRTVTAAPPPPKSEKK